MNTLSQHPIAIWVMKELKTEWRQRYALNGLLLQVVSSVMVVYLSVKLLNNASWNAIFWVVLLFVSVSSIAKSFISESRAAQLYYHGLISPQHLLIGKFIYNSLLNLMLATLCLLMYCMLLGNPVTWMGFYLAATLLGSIGFAASLTMISAISSKAGNSNLLMPVLSLPVLIPLLLILIKACKRAMDGIDSSQIYKDLGVLMIFNALIVVLAYILFPNLWKE